METPDPLLTIGSARRVIVPQVVLSCLIAGLIYISYRLAGEYFTASELWALFSIGFLLSWWIVYFSSRHLRLATLRTFLDDKSEFRQNPFGLDSPREEEPQPDDENDDPLLTKAAFSVGALGIFIAIITLFLSLVLQGGSLDGPYRETVRFLIALAGLVTVITMVFAIDILDTVTNNFGDGEKSARDYRLWFYRSVGPHWPHGGQGYAYFGFSVFSILIILSLAYYYPALAGLGVAFYAYLGYPVFYGYRLCGTEEHPIVEIDPRCRAIAGTFGFVLLAGTLVSLFL